MADVTIKYKDSTIAEMSDNGSKTLKTNGKYCEDDIVVEYVAKNTGVENVKRWDIVTTGETSEVTIKILEDAWLAEHRNDENLCVLIMPKFVLPHTSGLGNQGMYLCTNANKAMDSTGILYKSMSLYVHSNGGISARARKYGVTDGNNIGDIQITASGSLRILVAASYPLVAGEYVVFAFLV